ncbi:MAG: glycosyl hydrolase family 28-related protein [Pseudomonas sp.]|uniref:glycosyl hydrolase family 28-related protein n=1 Tax=Pseudomonas sp. TaxID=306 RepID=UPI0030F05517
MARSLMRVRLTAAISAFSFVLALLGYSGAALADDCLGEALPRADLLCSAYLPQPVLPDTNADSAAALQAGIDYAAGQRKGIFLPSGRYQIQQDLALRSYVSLVGSSQGATIIAAPAAMTAPAVGDMTYATYVNDLVLERLIFDNVRVLMHGRKVRDAIRYNAFINTNSRGPQLAFGSQPAHIIGNVFMRGRNYPGLGLDNLGNAPGLLIKGNFIGSPGEQELAQAYIDTEADLLLSKLAVLVEQGRVALDADQGNYITAWTSTSNLRGATFAHNFISGNRLPALWNPQTSRYDIGRDHGLYIKQYQDVEIYQNYFAGWPADATGHLKFRNAEGLVFAANYLDGINFMARPYDNSATLLMRNSYLFNNYLHNAGVDYWQNFADSPSKYIDTSNFLVFNNAFEASNTDGCLLTGTWNHTVGELQEGGNYYVAPFNGVPVKACDMRSVDAATLLSKLPSNKQALTRLSPPLPRYQHPGGVLRVGKGLSNKGGAQCLFDGQTGDSYGGNCLSYALTAGLGFVPEQTYIEFAYPTPVQLGSLTLRGYWRQAAAGTLGSWRLEGCSDWQCNYRSVIAAAQPLSFGTPLPTASNMPYRAFRLVFVGGSPSANGGAGTAGFSELQATVNPVGKSL